MLVIARGMSGRSQKNCLRIAFWYLENDMNPKNGQYTFAPAHYEILLTLRNQELDSLHNMLHKLLEILHSKQCALHRHSTECLPSTERLLDSRKSSTQTSSIGNLDLVPIKLCKPSLRRLQPIPLIILILPLNDMKSINKPALPTQIPLALMQQVPVNQHQRASFNFSKPIFPLLFLDHSFRLIRALAIWPLTPGPPLPINILEARPSLRQSHKPLLHPRPLMTALTKR